MKSTKNQGVISACSGIADRLEDPIPHVKDYLFPVQSITWIITTWCTASGNRDT